MRILFCTDPFWPSIGGVETLAAPMVRSLVGLGHEVLVLTNQPKSPRSAEVELGGAGIIRLPMHRSIEERDAAAIFETHLRLRAEIRSFAPDLIHLFATILSAYHYVRVLPGVSCPILFTEQTGYFRLGPQRTLQRQIMELADWYATCSYANAGTLHRLLPRSVERTTVIPNGIEFHDVPASLQVPPLDPPVLLCLGRHHLEQKGFDVAVDAFPAILERYPEASLILAGDGVDRGRLEQQVTERGLSARVRFTGWIRPDDVPAAIAGCTMMLVPSRFDPFGLVAAEAGAGYRPCVASDVGGLAEIIEDGKTGCLVPPDNPPALAAAVCELLARGDQLAIMGCAARARVTSLFRFERFVAEYDALYRDLLAGCPEPCHV